MEEYEKKIVELQSSEDKEGLEILGELAEAEKLEGFEDIVKKVKEAISSLEGRANSASEVSEYQSQEIESLGGSVEEIESQMTEIHAEADRAVEEAKMEMDKLSLKRISEEIEQIGWGIDRLERNEYLIEKFGDDTEVTYHNPDYLEIVSGDIKKELWEADVEKSWAINNGSINYYKQGPEKKKELDALNEEIRDRVSKIEQKYDIPHIGNLSGPVTWYRDMDQKRLKLLVSLGAGNSGWGIKKDESKTLREVFDSVKKERESYLDKLNSEKEELEKGLATVSE